METWIISHVRPATQNQTGKVNEILENQRQKKNINKLKFLYVTFEELSVQYMYVVHAERVMLKYIFEIEF